MSQNSFSTGINKHNIPLHILKTFLFLCCRRKTQAHGSGKNTEEQKLSLPISLPQIRDLQGQSRPLLPKPSPPSQVITPPPFLLNSFSQCLDSPAVESTAQSYQGFFPKPAPKFKSHTGSAQLALLAKAAACPGGWAQPTALGKALSGVPCSLPAHS